MPRRAARIDANQPEIVAALRRAGASVTPLSSMGKGVPDLLVGYQGVNYLLELKDPNALRGPAQAMQLTPDEVAWHESWLGQVAVICNIEEALQLIGA